MKHIFVIETNHSMSKGMVNNSTQRRITSFIDRVLREDGHAATIVASEVNQEASQFIEVPNATTKGQAVTLSVGETTAVVRKPSQSRESPRM